MSEPLKNPVKEVHELQLSHQYKVLVEFLKSRRPTVPAFDYAGPSNVEEIKFKLAQQQHHDLLMSIINPGDKNV